MVPAIPASAHLLQQPAAPSRSLPSLAAMGLDDDETLDPDWWPSPLGSSSSQPSRWRMLLPFGVTASMIAVASIVLVVLTVLSQLERPEGTGDVVLPAKVPEQSPGAGALVAAVAPTAILAASPVPLVTHAVAPTAESSGAATCRRGDNRRVATAALPEPPRLDDPVLIWLPEILAAAEETGVSPSLIAGVIEVESHGDRHAVSPHGARGLMQVMPEHLVKQGVPEHQWNDPAVNIMAGARLLQWHIEVHGTHWDGVAHYFGIGCDGFNCTDAYVTDVLATQAHYVPLIADPYGSGLTVLPQQ